MKKTQRILAAVLAVVLLISGISGLESVFAADVKGTEAASERMPERETAAGKAAEAARTGGTEAGTEQTESETPKQTESETKEPETAKQTESETKEPETAEQTEGETRQTESGTAEQTESETKEPETAGKPEKKPKAPASTAETGRVSLTNPKDYEMKEIDKETGKETGRMVDNPDDPDYDAEFAALIPDKNFRQAIYDSFQQHNWLSGNPDHPPETADADGNVRSRTDILKEILGTYQGPVSANNRGITDIQGIHYLKIASTGRDEDDGNNSRYSIDLRNNEITDLMPLVEPCNTSSYYYGGRLNGEDGETRIRNVYLRLEGNPWQCFPDPSNLRRIGYVLFSWLSQNGREIIDSDNLRYYFLRNEIQEEEPTQTFSGYLQIGCVHFEDIKSGEFVGIEQLFLNGQELDMIEDPLEMSIELTDQGTNKNRNADIYFSKLMKSGVRRISVSTDTIFKSKSWDSATTAIATNTTSLTYLLHPSFTIFDRVTTSGDIEGRARAYKFDETTNKPLKGAVFNLYRKTENGEGELVARDLETNGQGYTEYVRGLEPGVYYFSEIQAPDGYAVSAGGDMEFAIGCTSQIGGGVTALDYKSADGKTVRAPAYENHKGTFITTDMEDDVELYISDGAGSRIDDNSDIVAKVKIAYDSLNGKKNQAEEYKSLAEAETALNAHIRANEITGAVKVKVEYAENTGDAGQSSTGVSVSGGVSATVSVGNVPAVTVKADKTWEGISADDILPEITYELYQAKTADGEKTRINAHTITGTAAGADSRYDYVFEADSGGKRLPKYWKDENGEYQLYVYTIEEKIGETDSIVREGYIGEPSAADENGQITVSVTNIKKPSIVVKKSDAEKTKTDLSGVTFALELDQGNDTWIPVAEAETDADGKAEFKNLGWGTYRLVETKTWEGYLLLTDPITVAIPEPDDPSGYEPEYIYMVSNSSKYNVPASGGIGSIWFLLGGGVLLLAGGLWGYKRRVFCK